MTIAVIDKLDSWAAVWRQVRSHMLGTGAHPAQTVVLLPFFQLQAVARQSWAAQTWGAQGSPVDGADLSSSFPPRFETTTSWQRRISHFVPDAMDVSFDAGLDAARARQFLQRAGLGEFGALLLPRLVETVQQLGAIAAAIPPFQRGAWAAGLRSSLGAGLGCGLEAFASHEAAVARIALEWAAASRYASDVLFEVAGVTDGGECQALVVIRGLQPNALAAHLAEQFGEKALVLDLPEFAHGELKVQMAQGLEDEAQRAAACVLAHVAKGRSPVALPAVDRLVTRRISAMLSQRGLLVLDETGWKLSTTRAAASAISMLRAARAHATPDEHLDWLKACSVDQARLARYEQLLRKQNSHAAGIEPARDAIEFIADDGAAIMPWRELLASLRPSRSLSGWLSDFTAALQMSGQWQSLMQDAAGEQVIAALYGSDADALAILAGDSARMSLAEFSTWLQMALEGASFKPPQSGGTPDVVILPLAQLAARPFGAAVMAGMDEVSLPAAPDLAGDWTAAQRGALGLPSREALALERRDVWRRAMQVPFVDVLWRSAQGDEPLQPSPLLKAWLAQHPEQSGQEGQDAREQRLLTAQPSAMPQPSGHLLLGEGKIALSASSYQDLRTCPYRYFALRLLGLQEAKELDEEISKRDFGAWLHAVLSDFHRTRLPGSSLDSSAEADRALLDACAAERQQEMLGSDPGFVPFAAAWPQVRSSYLLWLQKHEAQGWRFESSELDLKRELGEAALLKGRLDRVDVLSGSAAQSFAVIDYKTESDASLKHRVADPLEDTQLIFYAALLGKAPVEAFYLGLQEKEARAVPQALVNEALPLLLEGVASDTTRIAQGHGLPALGEGMACEYCAARGLCRKDFWADV